MRCTSTKSGPRQSQRPGPRWNPGSGSLVLKAHEEHRKKSHSSRARCILRVLPSARSRFELDWKPAPQEVSNNFMKSHQLGITYIGGPTCLLEFGGVRLLTDPTFDPAGGEYKSVSSTFCKLVGPALDPEAIGSVDYVLLSHDHHFDNLDHARRSVLGRARAVFTTAEGAARLAGNSRGLKDWQAVDLPAPNQRMLCIVATPARHGPEGGDRGPVIGFILFFKDDPQHVVYVSGDTALEHGSRQLSTKS